MLQRKFHAASSCARKPFCDAASPTSAHSSASVSAICRSSRSSAESLDAWSDEIRYVTSFRRLSARAPRASWSSSLLSTSTYEFTA